MKISKVLVAAIIFFGLNVFAQDDNLPRKEVQIGLSGAFIPSGFDSSSDVYVIVNGVFHNGCYQWSRAEVEHVDAFNHTIKSIASVGQGMCIMVMVPFQKEVRLGKFVSGKHNLKFDNGDGTYFVKNLDVE